MNIRYKYLFLVSFVCLLCANMHAVKPCHIVSYNVENLFDAHLDTTGGLIPEEARDYAYSPNGERHWTYSKYQRKLQHISQVIANIGEWDKPALVGLLEIENTHCLQDLTRYHLRNYHYQFLHQESPDSRGIDCALLYDAKQFTLLDSAFISIPLLDRPTREIVYAKGVLYTKDTLHVFVCHFPSQLSGITETAIRRDIAFGILQAKIDSLILENRQANVLVMGDMNQPPINNLHGLTNQMIDLQSNIPGTHKYQGVWIFLDQFYTSGPLFQEATVSVYAPNWLLEDDTKYNGKKPIRTYQGFRYQYNGYSDHLPILLTIPNK